MLQNAVGQLAALHARGYALNMAVNLSASCLRAERLPEAIESILLDHGMAGEHLTVEITETVIMSNDAEVLATLEKLDQMGIRLAIDDFGTGYSSLAHLKRLPVDEIKVDRSFVMELARNGNDAVIVRSTIDLAHNLGLEVTAEGVETRDAWEVLGSLGCDNSQGYHMGRPLPADRLVDWLEESEYGVLAEMSGAQPVAQFVDEPALSLQDLRQCG